MEHRILRLNITMKMFNIENTIYPSLLLDERNVILIDCGFIGSLNLLEAELRKHGLSADRITGLVLTHHDHDHMGAAAALKRVNPDIKIYASAKEAPYISAQEKPLRLRQAEEMQKYIPPEKKAFGDAFCDMLHRVEPVDVDCLLHDGEHIDWCDGCTVIATPGHTPGHISLLVEKDSIIIVGDAFAFEGGVPVIANPRLTLDIKKASESMEKLLSMKAGAYYCYHGGVYSPEIS